MSAVSPLVLTNANIHIVFFVYFRTSDDHRMTSFKGKQKGLYLKANSSKLSFIKYFIFIFYLFYMKFAMFGKIILNKIMLLISEKNHSALYSVLNTFSYNTCDKHK